MAYTVRISKDRFKFSATHFTIFSEMKAEKLHGHNYQVSVDILFKHLDPQTGISAEFSELKQILKKLCDQLDEKVLLPANSPFVILGETETNVEVKYNERFYSFPKEDCEILEIVNTSSECLAEWVYNNLKEALDQAGAKSFSVSLQESQGQSVSFEKNTLFS